MVTKNIDNFKCYFQRQEVELTAHFAKLFYFSFISTSILLLVFQLPISFHYSNIRNNLFTFILFLVLIILCSFTFIKSRINPGYVSLQDEFNNGELQTNSGDSPQELKNQFFRLKSDSPDKTTRLLDLETPYFKCSRIFFE